MSDALIFILLFAAVALGYAAGIWREHQKSKQVIGSHSADQVWNRKHYLQGLTYLLDDKTDDAIDAFISAMEVNAETLETHLALGKVLRKRGELVGAVKIHENLLGQVKLSRAEQHIVQLELAKDYLHSGLLDRAEMLLKELIDLNLIDAQHRHEALERLLEVYRDMREWLQAIDIADRLTAAKFSPSPDKWRKMQAQFCCELAIQHRKDPMVQQKWIRSALRYDQQCVRASFLKAELEMQEQNTLAAIASVKCVADQDRRFVDEAIAPLQAYYATLDDPAESLQADLTALFDVRPSFFTLNALFAHVLEHGDVQNALALLQEALPKVEAFYAKQGITGKQAARKCSVATQLSQALQQKPQSDEELMRILLRLLEWPVEYNCRDCGFVGEQLHWLCPSCKHWASINRV